MKKKITNSLLLILVGIMFLVFAVGSSSNTTTSSGTSSEELELVEITSAYTSYSSYYIEGSIKNNTEKEYSYVQITFNLYDAEGAQIGTAIDNINNLEPNGIWKFKAIGLAPAGNVASYKMVEISGW